MNTPEFYMKKAERLDTLFRNVFSSGEGKELLEMLKELYVEGKLYQETDRATIYAIAQRDIILDFCDRVKPSIDQGIPGGEEIS